MSNDHWPGANRRLLVVSSHTVGPVKILFPGWDVVSVGTSLAGRRYEIIVVATEERDEDGQWFIELEERLPRGATPLFVV